MNVVAIYKKTLMDYNFLIENKEVSIDKLPEEINQEEILNIKNNFLNYENSGIKVFYFGIDELTSDIVNKEVNLNYSGFKSHYENSFFVVTKKIKNNEILRQLELSYLINSDNDIADLKIIEDDITNVILMPEISDPYLDKFNCINLISDENTFFIMEF